MTPTQREQLEQLFSRGLVSGLGDENQTCIEGALALVFDGKLTDAPSCVAEPDRRWAIEINDGKWASPEARAAAFFPIALAQAGTAGTDRTVWVRAVALGTIRRVLPLRLEAAGFHERAQACRDATTLEEAQIAAHAAYAAANTAAAAYAADAAAAAARAADAAAHAAYAAANTAAAYYAAAIAADNADRVLLEAVAVAMDAYRAEGRA